MTRASLQSGFTLIELITVVVLLGLLAVGAGMLIRNPIDAYVAQLRRQQLVDQGEMALRQIARDIRLALPNSIRIPGGSGLAVEMVNTVDGARYRDEPGGTDYILPAHVLDFTTADDEFNFLGNLVSATPAMFAAGDLRIVIYNTTADIYQEAVDVSDFEGIITRDDIGLTLTTPASTVDDPEDHITLSAGFRFTQQSPGQRAFIVDGPISYVCDLAAGRILRYSGYDYKSTQPTTAVDFGVAPGSVISSLSACDMSYSAGTSQRGGIVTIEITITDSGESVSLLHQVPVINVP